jgi:hypothetical protein
MKGGAVEPVITVDGLTKRSGQTAVAVGMLFEIGAGRSSAYFSDLPGGQILPLFIVLPLVDRPGASGPCG